MNTLTPITAILGLLFGTGGLILGILNYLRDRPVVKVSLQWNMEILDRSRQSEEQKCGVVTVTNAGRRPVYISHVCLVLPKSHENRLLLVVQSVNGRKLAEGDPPVTFVIPHHVQAKYAKDLEKIRVQLSDSTGRLYLSKRAKMRQACPPSKTD